MRRAVVQFPAPPIPFMKIPSLIWHLTHPIWAGQAGKNPVVNRLARQVLDLSLTDKLTWC